MAGDGEAVRAALDRLIPLLGHDVDPVGVTAGYTIAAAGASAIERLRDVILRQDGPHVPEKKEGQLAIDYIPNEERIARNAIAALVEIGAPAIPALLDLLARGAPCARKLAAFALGEIGSTGAGSPDMRDALCAAIGDAEPAVRVNIVEALGLLDADAGTLAALTAALKDADEEVRFSAALSLARLGPDAEPAVPVLSEALHDSNRYVPGYAVEALERIGTRDAAKALLPFLKNARWCPQTSPASTY